MFDWPALHAAVRHPPNHDRVPLWLGADVLIGSVTPELLRPWVDALGPQVRLIEIHHGEHTSGWQLHGPVDTALAALAQALHRAGCTGRWRNELLSVRDAQGQHWGRIERAAVRPLGLATHGVHLIGWTHQGNLWLQQRAHDKADDPGLWDTLVGGMVADGEDLWSTLHRETWEEAGLLLQGLHELQHRGCIHACRPSPEAQGRGHLVEQLDWFSALIPDYLAPVNQDGEVAQFQCLTPTQVTELITRRQVTADASLILACALTGTETAP